MKELAVVLVAGLFFGTAIGAVLNNQYLPYDIINKCELENAIKENQKCELYYKIVTKE